VAGSRNLISRVSFHRLQLFVMCKFACEGLCKKKLWLVLFVRVANGKVDEKQGRLLFAQYAVQLQHLKLNRGFYGVQFRNVF